MRLLVSGILLFSAGLLWSQDPDPKAPYLIGPEPAWAEPLPLPSANEVPDGQVSDGIYYLLTEEQIRVEPRESYGQFARKILNETGVQNGSEIQIGVDPAYETLELHKVEVLREGEWKQRLEPGIISVLRRETDMERFMLDGRFTVVVRLEDIRPGDVIRYSFTLRGANPVMAGRFFTSFSVGWSEPCAHMRERIWMPAGRRLYIKNHNTELKPRVTESDGGTLYEWETKNPPVTIGEANVPYWTDAYPWIEAGDMNGWGEVVDWALPLYDFEQPLPPELEARISSLKLIESREERILRALRMVQDDIRYFGTETGEHSHKPRPPSVVYNQRFGDCKEKVLLLGTILRRLDVPSYPVLVNSAWGRGIEDRQPSPGAFNHVILRVVLDGREYDVDPTRSHQRGPLRGLAVGDYGRGLVVRSGETRLRPVQLADEAAPRTEIEEIVELPDTKNAAPATLRVHTVLRGRAAENSRERFASNSREQLQEKYKRYYEETYPSIEVAKPFRHVDNEKENIFEIWEEYRIPNIWKPDSAGNRVAVSFNPDEITTYLKKPGVSGRKHPYEISHPVDVKLKTTVKLPEAWSVTPSDFKESNKFFDVTYDVAKQDGDAAVISSSYRSMADHVPAEALMDYRSKVERVQNALGYEFSYTQNAKAKSGVGRWLALWPMFVTGIFGVFAALVGVCLIWFLGRRKPPPFPNPADRHLDGIGGWLILVALSVVVRPFVALITLGSLYAPYLGNPEIWGQFTMPGGSYYSPAWLPVFLFEILVNCALVVFSLFLPLLFFRKQKMFPGTYAGMLVALAVCSLLDAGMLALIPKDNLPEAMKTELNSGHADTYRNVVAAVIWVPYLMISRRVKATFRR